VATRLKSPLVKGVFFIIFLGGVLNEPGNLEKFVQAQASFEEPGMQRIKEQIM